MLLTPAQKTTLHNWLVANAANLSDQQAQSLLNANASPAYWVWRTNVPVSDIYTLLDDQNAGLNGLWNWTTYQQQTVPQQDAWKQMFIVGQSCNFSLVNNRLACGAIFGNTGAGGLARDHIFAVSRRACTVFEKLFAAAVVSPPNNTGNDGIAGNRGTASNPDLLVIEAQIDTQTIAENR